MTGDVATDVVVVAMRSPLLAAGFAEILRTAGFDARIDTRAEPRRGGAVSTWLVDVDSAPLAAAAGAPVLVLDDGLAGSAAPAVSYTASADDLAAAIRGGAARRWSPDSSSDAGAPLGLSPREHEIVDLVIEGRTNQQVATTLGISANTVRTHLQNVMAKLGVSNRRELAAVVNGTTS